MKSTGASDILDLIEHLASEDAPTTLSSIAAGAGLAKSSCSRLLSILIEKRYVSRSEDGHYKLLCAVGAGGMTRDQIELVNLAEPLLQEAADQTGMSAFVAVVTPAGKLRYLVKVLPSNQELVYDRDISKLRDLNQVTSGLCMLAHMPSSGEVDPAQLADIRKNGIAVNLRGVIEGASGAAAPVFDVQEEVVAAFNLAGPRHNFENALEHIKRVTVEGAKALSARLSKDGTD